MQYVWTRAVYGIPDLGGFWVVFSLVSPVDSR